jgi:hypothetical protein
MFVECFSGLMGGGKSFYSVIRICDHIAKGGIVFTNIKLHIDPWFNESYSDKMKSFWSTDCNGSCRMELHKGGMVIPVMKKNKQGECEFEYNSRGLKSYLRNEYKYELQEGQYHYLDDSVIGPKLSEHLPRGSQMMPVLCILDEALDHFESNSKGSATAEFRSFLRHIRKLGINLVFIAQDFGSLEPKIRSLTHFVWRFRDMYTWDVPIFNRPLPPPWRDHVVCEKFHRSQFGKMKAEPVNKNTWVYRDTNVFGCYQSIALHNAGIKLADDMKTDFGDAGKIVKEKKKMNVLERVALFACLLISLVGLFRKPKVELQQTASVPHAVASKDDKAPEVNRVDPPVMVRFGKFKYLSVNGKYKYLEVNRIPYEIGAIREEGVVVGVSKDYVHLYDAKSGSTTFIYPEGRGLPEMKGDIAAKKGEGSISG